MVLVSAEVSLAHLVEASVDHLLRHYGTEAAGIFNLGGDLVRTIRREATTADEMAVATINWDLNTDRNLPVASGIYIYRVDVDGVGTKTDRLAIFVEQERLDNF